jgi:hypothetical protein
MGICFALNVQAANVTFAPDVLAPRSKRAIFHSIGSLQHIYGLIPG